MSSSLTKRDVRFRVRGMHACSAEHIATNQMSKWLKRFGKECGANVPEFFTHAYAEGAIDAFLDVFTRIKPSK